MAALLSRSTGRRLHKLAGEEKARTLQQLAKQGWMHNGARDAVEKKYEFKDFKEAMCFMNIVGVHAEGINHHPEWSNVYNRVSVLYTTHDVNGFSENDVKCANHCDKVAGMIRDS